MKNIHCSCLKNTWLHFQIVCCKMCCYSVVRFGCPESPGVSCKYICFNFNSTLARVSSYRFGTGGTEKALRYPEVGTVGTEEILRDPEVCTECTEEALRSALTVLRKPWKTLRSVLRALRKPLETLRSAIRVLR